MAVARCCLIILDRDCTAQYQKDEEDLDTKEEVVIVFDIKKQCYSGLLLFSCVFVKNVHYSPANCFVEICKTQ